MFSVHVTRFRSPSVDREFIDLIFEQRNHCCDGINSQSSMSEITSAPRNHHTTSTILSQSKQGFTELRATLYKFGNYFQETLLYAYVLTASLFKGGGGSAFSGERYNFREGKGDLPRSLYFHH